MMKLSFIIMLSFLGANAPAAEVPARCQGAAALDQDDIGPNYLIKCKKLLERIDATKQKMALEAKRGNQKVSVSTGNGQAGALRDLADSAENGQRLESQNVDIASSGRREFSQIAFDAQEMTKMLKRKMAEASDSRRRYLFSEAKADFSSIAKSADNHAEAARMLSSEFRRNAETLDSMSSRSRQVADRMETNRTPAAAPAPAASSGYGSTAMGLAGAAVITAGGLGGLYWVASSSIDKANKDAEARINQLNQSAETRINQANAAAEARINQANAAADARIAQIEDAAKKAAKELGANMGETYIDYANQKLCTKPCTSGGTNTCTATATCIDLSGILGTSTSTSTSTSTGTSTSTSTTTSTSTSTGTGT